MAISKDKRIKNEINRLNKIYSIENGIDASKLALVQGLIERAGFMRVECEDLEADLKEKGWVELFQQSDKVPAYERARPSGQSYQTLAQNYLKVIKQLDGLLPDTVTASGSDGFDEFTALRE